MPQKMPHNEASNRQTRAAIMLDPFSFTVILCDGSYRQDWFTYLAHSRDEAIQRAVKDMFGNHATWHPQASLCTAQHACGDVTYIKPRAKSEERTRIRVVFGNTRRDVFAAR